MLCDGRTCNGFLVTLRKQNGDTRCFFFWSTAYIRYCVRIRCDSFMKPIYGLWIRQCGLWIRQCGLWIRQCGLWIRQCGLWIRQCGRWCRWTAFILTQFRAADLTSNFTAKQKRYSVNNDSKERCMHRTNEEKESSIQDHDGRFDSRTPDCKSAYRVNPPPTRYLCGRCTMPNLLPPVTFSQQNGPGSSRSTTTFRRICKSSAS